MTKKALTSEEIKKEAEKLSKLFREKFFADFPEAKQQPGIVIAVLFDFIMKILKEGVLDEEKNKIIDHLVGHLFYERFSDLQGAFAEMIMGEKKVIH